MKKMNIIMIMIFAILVVYTSTASAAEILGYPIVAKQAKYYTMILGLMGASMAMVGVVYAYMWLADLKRRRIQELKSATAYMGKLAIHHAE